jgi:hypothetical protein
MDVATKLRQLCDLPETSLGYSNDIHKLHTLPHWKVRGSDKMFEEEICL